MIDKNNIEIYEPITFVKKVVGYGLIGYGILTILLPTGSVLAIMGGCALVGIDYKKLLKTMEFYGERLGYWIYANRNWKLIKRTIRMRFM